MTTPKRLRAVKDRRSSWARRHKELAEAFAADLGAHLPLPTAASSTMPPPLPSSASA